MLLQHILERAKMQNNEVKRSVPALAYLSILAVSMTMFIINATLVPLSVFFNVDIVHISWTVSCLGIGRMSTQIFCGKLADKYGRKIITLIGMVLMFVFFIGMPLTNSFVMTLVLTTIGGMGYGMVNTSMLAVIFDCFAPVGKNATAQSYVQLFFAGGGVIIPFIAEKALSKGINWSYLYWGCAIYTLILTICIFIVKFPKQYKKQATDAGFIIKPSLLKEGVLLCAAVFFIYSTGLISSTWISILASESFSIDSILALRALTIYNLGSVIGTIVFAQLVKKIHGTILLMVNAVVALISFSVCLLTSSMIIFFMAAFMAGFVVAISFNIGVSVGGEMFSDNAATISGWISVMSGLAGLTMPIIVGALKDSFGLRKAFSFVVVLLVIAILVTSILRKRYLRIKYNK